MNVSGSTGVDHAQPVQPPDLRRIQLQAALLKKIVEANQSQSAEIERTTAGKGNVIDIRV